MEKWEYLTEFCYANAENTEVADYLKKRWPDWEAPKYAPEAMIPALNILGEEGWELVHMEPVYVKDNSAILVHGVEASSNGYFCVFKRRKE